MGLPTDLPNLRLHTADAAHFLQQRRQRQRQASGGGSNSSSGGSTQGQQQQQQQQQDEEQAYDLVFMDAFDGQDDVPAALCTPGGCRRSVRSRPRL